MADAYEYAGLADQDGIYGAGNENANSGMNRFIKLIECKPDLLPSWWSSKKASKCADFGACAPNNWSDLGCAVSLRDVVKFYGDPSMPNQLRVFGKQVYGSSPAGILGGETILAVHVAGER